jgi:hypothetical protein
LLAGADRNIRDKKGKLPIDWSQIIDEEEWRRIVERTLTEGEG